MIGLSHRRSPRGELPNGALASQRVPKYLRGPSHDRL